MSRIFVAGLVNSETTLAIDGFPLVYSPVYYPFFRINTTFSGVGFNLAKALSSLGNSVDFATLVGRDDNGLLARQVILGLGLADSLIMAEMDSTAQSVILYQPDGCRQIHVDLKDIQERTFPTGLAEEAIRACDLAVICNINFARPLLTSAREAGKWIATDVHALADLGDAYNRDFLHQADILFMSDEDLPDKPENIARQAIDNFRAAIVVIGLGAEGALMAVRKDGFIGRFKPVVTRPVVNTIGAGDALFSAFLDCFWRTRDPYQAIRAAIVFASYKIGANGAADGFLTGADLDQWLEKIKE